MKTILMNRTLLGVFALLLLCNIGYTQCNEQMYELALAQAGKDVVLVRDFKVKLSEGTKRNPSPSSKFSVLMQKGITYRFTVSKNRMSATEPILQLFDRGELLASTYDARLAKTSDRFDFLCNRTGNYQVIVSMHESKEGCAIGIMGMVADSAFYAHGNKKAEDNRYVLYAGIATPLHFITDQPEVGRVSITIDRGEIIMKDSLFSALVPTEGPAKISITLYNKSDSIIEATDQDFDVIRLPAPEVRMEGTSNNNISSVLLESSARLHVTPDVYRIVEFYISDNLGVNTGYRSDSEFLTYEMINYLKSQLPQQRFYVKQILVAKPDGTQMRIGPLTYYIR